MTNAIERFRELHQAGTFVMPNPWDAGSAAYLEHLGFAALASSSGGLAFSRATADRDDLVTLDVVLAHVRDLVRATSLPVNADFQSGYSATLDGLQANVRRCVDTGCAGLSIEDRFGDELVPLDEAVARVQAARRAIDAGGVPVVLTARCEAYLLGLPDAARVAHERLRAFAAAGADCLFAPGVRAMDEITALVRAVAPKPINVIVGSPAWSLPELRAAGVRRISVGSALCRAAWTGFDRAARALLNDDLGPMAGGVEYSQLNALFGRRR